LRYDESQVVDAAYTTGYSRKTISLLFDHVMFAQEENKNALDAHNKPSENIAVDEERNLWQSPSEPSRWDQGIARHI
jgi:hypothetical protein